MIATLLLQTRPSHVDSVHIEFVEDMDTVNIGAVMSIRKFLFTVAIIALGGFRTLACAGQTLNGSWLTEDGSSRVAFQTCGAQECGRIVWLRESSDPLTGKAWRDKYNPDDALKERALIGLAIVSDIKRTARNRWEGALYNPLDGKTYSGALSFLAEDRLQLVGCAMAGLFCQTELWTRAAP